MGQAWGVRQIVKVAALAVDHRLIVAAGHVRQHRHAAGHGLQHGVGQPFHFGGGNQQVHGLIAVRHVRAHAQPMDAAGIRVIPHGLDDGFPFRSLVTNHQEMHLGMLRHHGLQRSEKH